MDRRKVAQELVAVVRELTAAWSTRDILKELKHTGIENNRLEVLDYLGTPEVRVWRIQSWNGRERLVMHQEMDKDEAKKLLQKAQRQGNKAEWFR